MWFFLLFIAIPVIEISLFVTVGGAIGLWPTILIVLITAVVGSTLMRSEGVRAMMQIQSALATGKNPASPMAHGALVLVAGMLLLTPGFFTDTLGILLMIPAVRTGLLRKLGPAIAARVHTTTTQGGQTFRAGPGGPAWRRGPGGDVIDGEYEVTDPDGPDHGRDDPRLPPERE
ncbi:FxsA family protein [Paroceanicella profunda]|uniref:FxsA family protein n=1 Tax=Paroceanicella profunda TaxID=2579971 RepID=A0A5B8FXM9_9RHOB|nr:FxsA family protein [Paroceanicella profunda]QDL91299.1 FxsA family protein [Paroceanicella profunda]